MSFPLLPTSRLLLRAFLPWDADVVQTLAGERDVAVNTLNVPHPYPDGVAAQWIASHGPAWEKRSCLVLAITTEDEGVVGAISLQLQPRHHRGEIGYWIGKPFWGRGYATEAAAAIVDLGFDHLDLNRIEGRHLVRNPASGRVLQKVGMLTEGVHRELVHVWGSFEDVATLAVLRSGRTPS